VSYLVVSGSGTAEGLGDPGLVDMIGIAISRQLPDKIDHRICQQLRCRQLWHMGHVVKHLDPQAVTESLDSLRSCHWHQLVASAKNMQGRSRQPGQGLAVIELAQQLQGIVPAGSDRCLQRPQRTQYAALLAIPQRLERGKLLETGSGIRAEMAAEIPEHGRRHSAGPAVAGNKTGVGGNSHQRLNTAWMAISKGGGEHSSQRPAHYQ